MTGDAGLRVSAASSAAFSASLTTAVTNPFLVAFCKNSTKRWRDDAADPVVVERIDRGLARGAAAEIAPGHDESLRHASQAELSGEVRPFVAGGVETQIVKQDLAVFAVARQLEITRRQDLVGVDILGREWADRSLLCG